MNRASQPTHGRPTLGSPAFTKLRISTQTFYQVVLGLRQSQKDATNGRQFNREIRVHRIRQHCLLEFWLHPMDPSIHCSMQETGIVEKILSGFVINQRRACLTGRNNLNTATAGGGGSDITHLSHIYMENAK